MSILREWIARLAAFVVRRRDAGLDAELQFHTDMLADDLERRGMDRAAARREAAIRLGGRRQIAESYADQRSVPLLESFLMDARYGLRALGRTPGFTVAALLTLALGIGANAAIFSLVNAVLLRPLPFKDAERIVRLGDREPDGLSNIGFLTFADIRDRNVAFEQMSVVRGWTPTLAESGDAERLPGVRVSWNYFEMLGASPMLGRTFQQSDDAATAWRVVILSHGLWQRRFSSDPQIVGRTLRMNDVDFRIVGVMPSTFEPLIEAHFYDAAQIWAPLGYDAANSSACRSCQHLKAIGKLKPGVTPEQATANLNAIRRQLRAEYPKEYPAGEMGIAPMRDEIAGPVAPALLVLLGAVGFVLLIACANVANLLLARAVSRTREMAVRAALGAGRGRLVRQTLTESMLLGVLGGVLGLGLAGLLLNSVAVLAPVSVPRLDSVAIDARVLAFAAALSAVTGIAFGVLPALRASAPSLRFSLTSETRTTVGAASGRARQALVVAEIALALVLVAAAGLMLRSVGRLMRADPGFDPEHVLTLQFSLVGQAYREDPSVVAFQDRLLERVRALPGVESAALAGQVPMGGNYDSWGFHIEGPMSANPADAPSVERYSVTPDYFRVMGIPLRRGRLVTEHDTASSPPVIVISETTANTVWAGADPIGQRVRIGDSKAPFRTVVGIVGDVRHFDLAERPQPQMYTPQTQITDSFLVLTVRSATSEPERLAPTIRTVMKELDAAVPIYDVHLMKDLLGRSFDDRRFVMQLLGAFAGMALLLAAIGLYGVISYSVAHRTREVGLRVALGARPFDILRLVFASGAWTVTTGIVIGVAGALILTRFLRTLLFGVGSTDAATYAVTIAALVGVTLLAHWVPIRRALSVDPAIALRQE